MHDQTRTPPSDQKPPSDGNPTAPPWPRSPDGNLDRAFERLVGDRPSAEDRAMLYRVRDSLGIGPNDAIWTLLFAFQHYHSLYARFPKMIRAAAVSLAVVLVAALAGGEGEVRWTRIAKGFWTLGHPTGIGYRHWRLSVLWWAVLGRPVASGALAALMIATYFVSLAER
jgi:hypothetical protein